MQQARLSASAMPPAAPATLPAGSVVHPDFKKLTETDASLEQRLSEFKAKRMQRKQQYAAQALAQADDVLAVDGDNGHLAAVEHEIVDLTAVADSPQLLSSALHISAPADEFLSLSAYETSDQAEGRKRRSAAANGIPAPAHQPSAKRPRLQQQHQASNLGWLHSQHKDLQNSTLRLHEEILDFCSYVAPLPAEHERRQQIIHTITALIQRIFPQAEVLPFGSFATHLYLPISDIDLCCFQIPETWHGRSRLDIIAEELKRQNVASAIEVIAKARIPIIKLTEATSGIKVDISFSVEGGITAAKFLNDQIGQYPAIRPLVLVLKYFLSCRLLNDTYSGGIGSFVLQMLVLSHLQHYERHHHVHGNSKSEINLGLLLLTFFELYGKSYNYYTTGIDVRNTGRYYNKMIEQRYNEQRPYLLSIINPLEPSHDISSNSFGILKIRRAFYFAYQRLIALCNESQPASTSSMLSAVLSIDPEMKDLRPHLEFLSQNIDLEEAGSDANGDEQRPHQNKRVKLGDTEPLALSDSKQLPEYSATAEADQGARHQLLEPATSNGSSHASNANRIKADDQVSSSESESSSDDDSSVVITPPPTQPQPPAAPAASGADSFAQADDFVTFGTAQSSRKDGNRDTTSRKDSKKSKKRRGSALSSVFSHSSGSTRKDSPNNQIGASKRSKKRSEREKKHKRSRKKQTD